MIPGTVLQKHPLTWLYLDEGSASLLKLQIWKMVLIG